MRNRYVQHRKPLLSGTGACSLLFFFWIAGSAAANEVTGYVDLISTYNETDIRSGGRSRHSETDGFLQQYGLTLNKALYPKLFLLANGVFEKNRFDTTTDGTESVVTAVRYRPFVDLTLRDPLFTAGANYGVQEVKRETSGSSSRTTSETTSAVLSWRPSDLPMLQARWLRNEVYDQGRTNIDDENEIFAFTTLYEPADRLTLRYQYTEDDSLDKIHDVEQKTRAHDGKASYDRSLFNTRLALYTDYEMIRRETEVFTPGSPEATVQLFASSGLSLVNDNTASLPLETNPALTNNDTSLPAGIAIGLPTTTPGARNIGLDLGLDQEVSSLAVWVGWNNTSLPAEIANVFSWTVYTSRDNQTWSPWATVFPAVFDPIRNRFELRFPTVRTRYIKVVVRPLTQAQALASATFSAAADQQIFVTELQAFLANVPLNGPLTTTTRIGDVVLRARLLNVPFVTYDFSYFTVVTEGIDTRRRSTLANILSASERFDDRLTGSARVGIERSSDNGGETTGYLYGATLNATPRITVSNVLTYSGRFERTPESEVKSNALFLNNTARLYPGVDAFVSGGASFEAVDTGRRSESRTLLLGASIVPRPKITITPNYSETRTEVRVPDEDPVVTKTKREDLSITYIPVPALYLAVSWSIIRQDDRADRMRNYSVTWSPFSGGALQLTASYTENTQSFDETTSKLLTESVRWNVSTRMYLMASLFKNHVDSLSQDQRSSGASLEFRYTF